MAKNILFIEDDAKTSRSLKDILGDEYALSEAGSLDEALRAVASRKFDLIIYDMDIQGGGGLEGYKKLRRGDHRARIMVISSLNDIALAVSASKLKVADYLRKPLEEARVRESVNRNVSGERRPPLAFDGMEGALWLHGIGSGIKTLLAEVESAIEGDDDVVLFGAVGIDKGSLARVIHNFGAMRARRFAALDLASFGREFTESHFWATMQELLEERLGEVEDDELCGTVFLKGMEGVSEHFFTSIVEFLRKRKRGATLEKIDRSIRVILSIQDEVKFAELEGGKKLEGFLKCVIPPLKDRKEDIPSLIGGYLKELSKKNNKNVNAISTEALKFFMIYDWPGNYRELELALSLAAQKTTSEVISMKDLPLNLGTLAEEHLNESTLSALPPLSEFRRGFEKKMYGLVLEDVNGDAERAASFLDIPKTAFSQRARDLGLAPRK